MNTGLRRAVAFGLALSTFGLAAAPALAEPTDEHFRRNQDRYDRAKPDRPQPSQPETRPPERPSQPERPDRPAPPQGTPPGNAQPVPGRPQHWRDPPAQPRPPQVISPGYDPGRHYYPGHVYRPRPPHYVVRPGFGARITVLPPGYRTLWYGGLTYYVVDDIYYRREPNGYVVVERPDYDDREVTVSDSPDEEPFVYPNRNQDEKQQALDRYECHRWAVKQTGYDPTEPMGGVDAADAWQKRADYRRAQGACLEGRGYTVR